MKKIKYIIQILAVIAIFGCTEDDAFKSNKGDIRVTAGFASTRTTFTEDNGTVHVTWNKEDEIGVFTDGQMNLRYTAQKEGSETEFSATDKKLKATEGQKVYAYYPYSYESANKQTVKLPDLRIQSYKENASDYDFIYATDYVENNKLSLQFKHLFAFLKIKIPLRLIPKRGEGCGLRIQSSEYISCNSYLDFEKEKITSEKYNDIRYSIPDDETLKDKEEITCYIAILPQIQNAEIKIMSQDIFEDCLLTKKVPNGGFKAGNVYTLYLQESQAEIEREALLAFYKATNGDNWINNDNWCSDKPLSEWYGVTTFHGHVEQIDMIANNLSGKLPAELGNLSELNGINISNNPQLSGEIPPELGNLKKLRNLYLPYNNLSGIIPSTLGNMENMERLILNNNKLSGAIPPELGDFKNLLSLSLDYNNLTGSLPDELGNLSKSDFLHLTFSSNNLTGEIPESYGKLKNLEIFNITYCSLSGRIPKSFMELGFWQYTWPWILEQNGDGFEQNNLFLKAPDFSVTTYTGQTIDQSIYAQNKYTILLQWANHPTSETYIAGLKSIYNNYKKKGIEIVGYTNQLDNAGIAAFAYKHSIPWPMFRFTSSGPGYSYLNADEVTKVDDVVMLGNTCTPAVNIVNSEGIILIDSHYTVLGQYANQENHLQILAQFFQEKLGNPDPIDPEIPDDPNKPYESTDYSKDGNVILLQQATEGKGIDIVLMGDAYSDRLIADGTYKTVMQKAADYLFTEEPLKSFRNLFNVYMVDVVSKNEVYGGETALSTYFGNGTLVGGNDNKCFEYAQKAISGERTNEALIVVMINSPKYAGTCWMYNNNITNDYGSGPSVAYFPVGTDEETFEQLLHHEACGHGFSKLADEYAYQDYGAMPASEIQDYQTIGANYGWWKNVDFTSDPTQVKWSKFISDNRYKNDKLGVFQGACTYWTGAYRPTDVSIMRYNTDGFNAPSREAIYYRIHRLAYGSPWAFDYETFVAYDAKNRKAATRAATWNPAATKRFRENHCPPVVVKGSWRNAKRSR